MYKLEVLFTPFISDLHLPYFPEPIAAIENGEKSGLTSTAKNYRSQYTTVILEKFIFDPILPVFVRHCPLQCRPPLSLADRGVCALPLDRQAVRATREDSPLYRAVTGSIVILGYPLFYPRFRGNTRFLLSQSSLFRTLRGSLNFITPAVVPGLISGIPGANLTGLSEGNSRRDGPGIDFEDSRVFRLRKISNG